MYREEVQLGSVQVRWNDFVGTAAADGANVLLNTRSLYEIAGIERDRWAIVGIDLSLRDSTDEVVVYGVDRTSAGPDAADVDDVAVTAFHLDRSVRFEQFLKEAFALLSVRLLSSAVSGQNLIVAE